MGLISYSTISDGSTATASQVNTPLTTIYNEFNGNITNANIANGASISEAKISGGIAGMFGTWLTWTPTITGFSANPTGAVYSYIQIGKMVTLAIAQPNNGTSNAATITLTLPVNSSSRAAMNWVGYGSVVDNGVAKTTPGMFLISPSGSIVTIVLDFGFNAFTSSGSKKINYGTITYEAA